MSRLWAGVREALSSLRAARSGAPVFHDPAYRLPLPSLETTSGLEPRRSEWAVAWLLHDGKLAPAQLRAPHAIAYGDLARVHPAEHLEGLARPDVLARIFGVDERELPADEVMRTVRLACGGTLAAAREAVARRGPAFNFLGGFHHAGPSSAGGLSPVNDLAVAIAALRSEGFAGRVVVLDLDAHPPDGTAACLASDPSAFIGSISGSDWGPLGDGVDETVLPERTGDEGYLLALRHLLLRTPRADLAFVIAGGDVLAGDRLGRLGLTLRGARLRDLAVAEALAGTPSVWLPGGGYTAASWRVLAGTYLAVVHGSRRAIPRRADPLSLVFRKVYASLRPEDLMGSFELTEDDVVGTRSLGARGPPRLLGAYTAEGISYAFWRYGLEEAVRRLGYDRLRVDLDRVDAGERVRLYGRDGATEHLLVEAVLARGRVAGRDVLYVHWLTLRHPRASFAAGRTPLPGQDVPGLGLAAEATELLLRMAERLGLAGVSHRPAHFHVALGGKKRFRFADPARQGRFLALARDLASLPLADATRAVAEGRVRMNGAPYAWEADDMVAWLEPPGAEDPGALEVRDTTHFVVG